MNLNQHPAVARGFATPVQAATRLPLATIAAMADANVDAMFILRLRDGGEFGELDYALLDTATIARLAEVPDHTIQTMRGARPAKDVLAQLEAVTAWTPDGSALPTDASFPAHDSVHIDARRVAREIRFALESRYIANRTAGAGDYFDAALRKSTAWHHMKALLADARTRQEAVPGDAWTGRLVVALGLIETACADGLDELGMYERILRTLYELVQPELAARFDLPIDQRE